MWVFLNDAFVSIVQDRSDADLLLVRGRIKGDVERFLGPRAVKHGIRAERTPDGDYLWRAWVPRAMVKSALMEVVDVIDYPNFKGSIPTGKQGDMRHDAYMGVWTKMLAFQHAFKRRFKK